MQRKSTKTDTSPIPPEIPRQDANIHPVSTLGSIPFSIDAGYATSLSDFTSTECYPQ